MPRYAVWGVGAWPERRLVVPEGDPMECITEDSPEFDLLPLGFCQEWGETLGSEHWAEVVRCSEEDLDRATRFSASVQGYREIV